MCAEIKVSVIMPVERIGGDAERAIESVLRQEAPFPFELILVSAAPLAMQVGTAVRNVIEPNRNPATRRNRAVSEAGGEILAFIDDDAVADAGWLATAVAYLDAHPDVAVLGGPDPAPPDSTRAELIAETLLATPWIGSGLACHENRAGIFPVTSASDIALVNLFVRRRDFRGFDESIGYIGEDTSLIAALMPAVVYHSGVRVFHRRRPFPGPYLRQRWRYRVKTGEMLARGSAPYAKNRKIGAFLLAGTLAILTAPIAVVPYFAVTLILGARATRLPRRDWIVLPFAFAAHHATYFAGIVWGAICAKVR
ncbi:MAG: glycosyltransferase [Acidobacteriota bacterium]|nr:glycosyltransferase [Acidobacteriota bacterium]